MRARSGLCKMHYERKRRHGDPTVTLYGSGTSDGRCSIQGCESEHVARGLCRMHYSRWLRHRSTDGAFGFRPRVVSLLARADRSGDCWLWTGSLNSSGYGPHRALWELLNGPVPEGLDLDHLCNVRHCIRPDHLEPVTRAENGRRARERRAVA